MFVKIILILLIILFLILIFLNNSKSWSSFTFETFQAEDYPDFNEYEYEEPIPTQPKTSNNNLVQEKFSESTTTTTQAESSDNFNFYKIEMDCYEGREFKDNYEKIAETTDEKTILDCIKKCKDYECEAFDYNVTGENVSCSYYKNINKRANIKRIDLLQPINNVPATTGSTTQSSNLQKSGVCFKDKIKIIKNQYTIKIEDEEKLCKEKWLQDVDENTCVNVLKSEYYQGDDNKPKCKIYICEEDLKDETLQLYKKNSDTYDKNLKINNKEYVLTEKSIIGETELSIVEANTDKFNYNFCPGHENPDNELILHSDKEGGEKSKYYICEHIEQNDSITDNAESLEYFGNDTTEDYTIVYKNKDNKLKKYNGTGNGDDLFAGKIINRDFMINNDHSYLYVTNRENKQVQIYAEYEDTTREDFLTSQYVMGWNNYYFTENGKNISGSPCRYFIYRAFDSTDENIKYYVYHLYRFKDTDNLNQGDIYKIMRLDEADLESSSGNAGDRNTRKNDNKKSILFKSATFNQGGLKPIDYVVDDKYIYILAGYSNSQGCIDNNSGLNIGKQIFRYDHLSSRYGSGKWEKLNIKEEKELISISNDRKYIFGLDKDKKKIYKVTKLTKNNTHDPYGERNWEEFLDDLGEESTRIFITHKSETTKDWCKTNYAENNNTKMILDNPSYGFYCKLQCNPGWTGRKCDTPMKCKKTIQSNSVNNPERVKCVGGEVKGRVHPNCECICPLPQGNINSIVRRIKTKTVLSNGVCHTVIAHFSDGTTYNRKGEDPFRLGGSNDSNQTIGEDQIQKIFFPNERPYPLTRELYKLVHDENFREENGISEEEALKEYNKANFIPNYEFDHVMSKDFDNFPDNIVIDGHPNLQYIGFVSFRKYPNPILIKGSFPKLKIIYNFAFQACINKSNDISLINLPNFEEFKRASFYQYKGIINIKGNFNKLKYFRASCFRYIDGLDSSKSSIKFYGSIANDLPNLTILDAFAFSEPNNVNIIFRGSYPNLEEIGKSCFDNEENYSNEIYDNKVNIDFDELNKLTTIGYYAFRKAISVSFNKTPVNLTYIGQSAFEGIGQSSKDIINFGKGLPNLTSFQRKCFENCKVKILISGDYSRLESIGEYCFNDATNKNSKIELIAGINDNFALKTIDSTSFKGYDGLLKIYGNFESFDSDADNKSNLITTFEGLSNRRENRICINNKYIKNFSKSDLQGANGFYQEADNEINLDCDMLTKYIYTQEDEGDDAFDKSEIKSVGSNGWEGFQKNLTLKSTVFKKLEKVDNNAFKNFIANFIYFEGDFGKLKEINNSSFKNVNNVYFFKNSASFLKKIEPKKNLCNYSNLQIIGEHSFAFCKKVEGYIKCPNLKTIGDSAFSNIQNLKLLLEVNNFNFITSNFLSIFSNSNGSVDIINNSSSESNDKNWSTIFSKQIYETSTTSVTFNICYTSTRRCNPNFNNTVDFKVNYDTDSSGNDHISENVNVNVCGNCNYESRFETI